MPTAEKQIVLTRTEIARAVRRAFDRPPVSVDDLIDEARRNDARAEVLEALDLMSRRRRFNRLSEIWGALPGMPVS